MRQNLAPSLQSRSLTMTRWVGLVLLALVIRVGSARAHDFGSEAKAWSATDVSLSRSLLTVDSCTRLPSACAEALNLAATLLLPQRHLELKSGQWELVALAETAGETLANTYKTKIIYTAKLREGLQHNSLDFGKLMDELLRLRPLAVPKNMLWGYALNGYLLSFDAHAYLYPVSKIEARSAHTSTFGAGFNVDHLEGGAFVHTVYRGSPADKAGLRFGDQILATQKDDAPWIDGFDDRQFKLISEFRLGLKIRRAGQLLEVHIPSGPFTIESVEGDLASDDVGRITVRDFPDLEVCGLVQSKLENLKAMGMHHLILDLRGNTGGNAEAAACVAGLFVGTSRAFDHYEPIPSLLPSAFAPLAEHVANAEIEWTSHTQIWSDSLVVLVDGLTRSGGEALAQAIKTYRPDARLVGERTSGKGSMQTFNKINPTLVLGYTAAKLYLADGLDHQRVGVTPHFQVPLYVGASAADRYYPREGDLHPNALAANMSSEPLRSSETLLDCDFHVEVDAKLDNQLLTAIKIARNYKHFDQVCGLEPDSRSIPIAWSK